MCYDPDTKKIFTANNKHINFKKARGKDREFYVMGLFPNYDHDNPSDEDWEPWGINDCLFQKIVLYYRKHSDQHIQIVEPETGRMSSNKEPTGSVCSL